jgi:hypothetical protein
MGMKRITGIVEVTYAADDPRTLEELLAATGGYLATEDGSLGQIAGFIGIRGSVDPDAEPSLPETGRAADPTEIQ